MKLHWSPRSPYVRKVMVVAHETGQVDRLDRVRSVVATTRPNQDVMRDNPLSKIPTLIVDNSLTLYDSRVICEYIDSFSVGNKLFPAHGDERWNALRRQALGDGLIDLLVAWRNERERPEPSRSQSHLAAFSTKAVAVLDWLEREVELLPLDRFCIGQAAIGCALGYLDFRFADVSWREGREQLAGWQEGFERRPSAIATRAVDDA